MLRGELERFLRSDVVLIASIAFILVVTLTPMAGDHEVHLGPLRDVLAAFSPAWDPLKLADLLGNIALFAPFGIVLGVRGLGGRQAVLLGCALSTAIELTQLFVPGRTTSVDDVLLNTLGTALGFLVGRRVPVDPSTD